MVPAPRHRGDEPKGEDPALSGGNQQKVLIARAFASEAEVLLLDDPTRGVDVATKTAVYAALEEARSAGRTIIVYSTEDAEFHYCDRVYVFSQGRISGQLSGTDISGPEIVRLSYALVGSGAPPSPSQEPPPPGPVAENGHAFEALGRRRRGEDRPGGCRCTVGCPDGGRYRALAHRQTRGRGIP